MDGKAPDAILEFADDLRQAYQTAVEPVNTPDMHQL